MRGFNLTMSSFLLAQALPGARVPQHSCNQGQMLLKASPHAVSWHGQNPPPELESAMLDPKGLVLLNKKWSKRIVFEPKGGKFRCLILTNLVDLPLVARMLGYPCAR